MRSSLAGLAAVAAALVISACGGGTSQQTANDVSQGPGHGADSGSLYRASNLSKALDSMKSQIGANGKVTTFKLEPSSIKSEVEKDGKAQTLIINSKFDATPVAIGAAVSAPFQLSAINAGVPEKIVNALSSKGVSLKDVDYFVVTDLDGATRWLVYTTGKGRFEAKLDGSGVKPLGSSSGAATASTSAKDAQKQAKEAEQAAQSSAKSAQSVQDCISKAGTDASALQKCATGG